MWRRLAHSEAVARDREWALARRFLGARIRAVRAHHTTDAAEALAKVSEFLGGDPVTNNVVILLLASARDHGRSAPMWWVEDSSGTVRGTLVGPGSPMPAILGPMGCDAATALAEAGASTPPVRRVNGPADAVATFAGAFATISGVAARPVGGERIYEASRVQIVGDPAGRRRPATDADYETIVEFVAGFGAETGTGRGGPDADRQRAAGFIEAGRPHVWEVDSHLVASTVVIPPAHGVSRVTFVYTAPHHRGHGYASRLVSELTADIIAEGARPILYTQLENPISSRIYQRIGYKVVSEQLRYEFELPEDDSEPRIV